MGYYFPAAGESVEDFYLGVAAAMVQRFAPVPDPEPADYAERAERAERLLYDYLSSTQGGALTSVSASAGSLGFAQMAAVKALVRDTMGSYYTSGFRSDYIRRG